MGPTLPEPTYTITATCDGFLVFPSKEASDRHFADTSEFPEYEYLAEFFEEKYAKLFVNALEMADAGAPIGEGTGIWEDEN